MDNLSELKQTWHSAQTDTLPEPAAMIKMIKQRTIRKSIKSVVLVMIALGMIVAMIWVLINYRSLLIATRIGEAFIFIAIFILMGKNLFALRKTARIKSMTNEAFLNYLKQEKLKYMHYQYSLQVVGFCFASAGLLLYLYEIVAHDYFIMAVAYGLAVAWIAVMWFVVRPYSVRKRNERLKAKILKLEKILEQLNNNET